METRLGVCGWRMSCQSRTFSQEICWGQVRHCQEALGGCALTTQSSQPHDLVPTWPTGEGCDAAPPALIAKAGVNGKPALPPSPEPWHVPRQPSSDEHPPAASPRAVPAGCKGVGLVVGWSGGGKCYYDLLQQSSYFQKEKPKPWQAVLLMDSLQEEPRQTCTSGCPRCP